MSTPAEILADIATEEMRFAEHGFLLGECRSAVRGAYTALARCCRTKREFADLCLVFDRWIWFANAWRAAETEREIAGVRSLKVHT